MMAIILSCALFGALGLAGIAVLYLISQAAAHLVVQPPRNRVAISDPWPMGDVISLPKEATAGRNLRGRAEQGPAAGSHNRPVRTQDKADV